MTSVTSSGNSVYHESAIAQTKGLAPYVDDIAETFGTLYAAPILSKVAHGKLLGLQTQKAQQVAGVVGIVTHQDVIGDKMLAAFAHDEPIFAFDKVEHVGQVIGLVIANSVQAARAAAKLVQIDVESLPAILDPREALKNQSFVLPPVTVRRGDAKKALGEAAHTISGSFEIGGQEHFYLEGQVAYSLPQENNEWLVYSSTQHPGEVQHWVAHALGIPSNKVVVQCRRMGGGFGGKETQAGHIAVWATLAAKKFGAPVKLRLDRDDDFVITGKRHPFAYDYTVGFDNEGRLSGLQLTLIANCGFSADLSGPVADRAIFHSDNAYYLSDVEIVSYRCKTNTQSHTAFRGFGGPQGVIAIETIMGEVARHLNMDPFEVRLKNLYGLTERNVTHYQMKVEDNILSPLMTQLAKNSNYYERRREIADWNKNSSVLKRGLAITPVKFGISFTATLFNQAGALVHVYTDGSVVVNHGGTEMGQGLHTKVTQVVAAELGLDVSCVKASASDTSKVPNASATAASSGTDLNGRAAQFAARQIRANLAKLVARLDDCSEDQVQFEAQRIISPKNTRSFIDVVGIAYRNRIQLWSDGFYATPKIHYDSATLTGRPFYYFAYGAACSEVVIDTLTGESRVLKVDILHDVGNSLNQEIDIGQIEGGFVQGVGWLTTEELVWGAQGQLQTHAPSTYKIPTIGDVPAHLNVQLWHEANPEDNVGGSKAVGEPPFMLGISVWEALRDAVSQATGKPAVLMNAPATAERIFWAAKK